MGKLLTALDIKILQALCEIGPRNLSKVARIVEIPRYTLEFRIKRMKSNPQISLKMHANVYHTNLGLKKAVVVIEAEPGKEQLLSECLKVNGFWLYVCRSYGMSEGCTAIYAIPVERCREFEEFMYEIKNLGVAKNIQIYWSTCFHGGRITSDWFDSLGEHWIFPWNDWIKDVQTQTTDLPYTLIESKSYLICADDIDVQMLMWLEVDASKSIEEIAKKLGMTRQRVQFHYKEHLLKKNLIEDYQITTKCYGDSPSVMVLFIIFFPSYELLAKFAKSLFNKFFVTTTGKIFGENAILTEVFLPLSEFRNFIDTLSILAKMKLVRSYKYAIQDLRMVSRQTISGEFFRKKSWIYNNEEHMKMLSQLISKSENLS
jgi:DNA-binding Lrp family transcriptional regulator